MQAQQRPKRKQWRGWEWKDNFSMTWKTAGLDMRTVVLCHNARGFPAFWKCYKSLKFQERLVPWHIIKPQ